MLMKTPPPTAAAAGRACRRVARAGQPATVAAPCKVHRQRTARQGWPGLAASGTPSGLWLLPPGSLCISCLTAPHRPRMTSRWRGGARTATAVQAAARRAASAAPAAATAAQVGALLAGASIAAVARARATRALTAMEARQSRNRTEAVANASRGKVAVRGHTLWCGHARQQCVTSVAEATRVIAAPRLRHRQ
jgi:hypothetical protein